MARHHPPGMHRERTRQRPGAVTPPRPVADERANEPERDARDSAARGRADRRSKRDGSIARETSLANARGRLIRNSTYEQRRRIPKCQTLGTLDDELALIAKRLQQLACTADIVVWAHEARIFAAPADSAAKVPPASTIGLYGTGVLLAEIEDDLVRARERAR